MIEVEVALEGKGYVHRDYVIQERIHAATESTIELPTTTTRE
jgi:hypothetical protein